MGKSKNKIVFGAVVLCLVAYSFFLALSVRGITNAMKPQNEKAYYQTNLQTFPVVGKQTRVQDLNAKQFTITVFDGEENREVKCPLSEFTKTELGKLVLVAQDDDEYYLVSTVI